MDKHELDTRKFNMLEMEQYYRAIANNSLSTNIEVSDLELRNKLEEHFGLIEDSIFWLYIFAKYKRILSDTRYYIRVRFIIFNLFSQKSLRREHVGKLKLKSGIKIYVLACGNIPLLFFVQWSSETKNVRTLSRFFFASKE